jgi:phosphate starvation-inducible membrane PsiE
MAGERPPVLRFTQANVKLKQTEGVGVCIVAVGLWNGLVLHLWTYTFSLLRCACLLSNQKHRIAIFFYFFYFFRFIGLVLKSM